MRHERSMVTTRGGKAPGKGDGAPCMRPIRMVSSEEQSGSTSPSIAQSSACQLSRE